MHKSFHEDSYDQTKPTRAKSGMLAVAQSILPFLAFATGVLYKETLWWEVRQNNRLRKSVLSFASWLVLALVISAFCVGFFILDAFSYERSETGYTWRLTNEALAEVHGLQDNVAALTANDIATGNGLNISAAFNLSTANATELAINSEQLQRLLSSTQQHDFDTVEAVIYEWEELLDVVKAKMM